MSVASPAADVAAPLLELEGINTYYGQIHILQDSHLVVREGELVCLLGGNASGKSTTLKTILGLVRPRTGRVMALVYPRIAPTRLMWLLAERGIGVVEVPDEEFETQGSNVLALGPRRALALEGNDETRRRMWICGKP